MIALVPARGGSKGVPRKNVRDVAGKPLIVWSIEAALAARHISQVVVTTDDEEIAAVARAAGAEVPFMRPTELASDTARAQDVYLHAYRTLEAAQGDLGGAFTVLLPTTPCRSAADIDGAIELFRTRQAKTVIGMRELEVPVEWLREVDDQGRMTGLGGRPCSTARRQDCNPVYTANGAVYVFDWQHFVESDGDYFPPGGCYAYIMPPLRSLDIDHEWELTLVDVVLRQELHR